MNMWTLFAQNAYSEKMYNLLKHLSVCTFHLCCSKVLSLSEDCSVWRRKEKVSYRLTTDIGIKSDQSNIRKKHSSVQCSDFTYTYYLRIIYTAYMGVAVVSSYGDYWGMKNWNENIANLGTHFTFLWDKNTAAKLLRTHFLVDQSHLMLNNLRSWCIVFINHPLWQFSVEFPLRTCYFPCNYVIDPYDK
jgi:hypothetical protein